METSAATTFANMTAADHHAALTRKAHHMTDLFPSTMNTTKRLTCVRYTDAMSIGHCSYNDLALGAKHCIVGANGKAFGASKPGDRVIIVANQGKKRYFTVVQIVERLAECSLWAEAQTDAEAQTNAGESGHVWSHNYIYTPLIGITEITDAVTALRDTVAGKLLLNPTNFFHARFCSKKLNPLLDGMLASLAAP
jgi:hypothetical protein